MRPTSTERALYTLAGVFVGCLLGFVVAPIVLSFTATFIARVAAFGVPVLAGGLVGHRYGAAIAGRLDELGLRSSDD